MPTVNEIYLELRKFARPVSEINDEQKKRLFYDFSGFIDACAKRAKEQHQNEWQLNRRGSRPSILEEQETTWTFEELKRTIAHGPNFKGKVSALRLGFTEELIDKAQVELFEKWFPKNPEL